MMKSADRDVKFQLKIEMSFKADQEEFKMIQIIH